jgi:hypothetical protein
MMELVSIFAQALYPEEQLNDMTRHHIQQFIKTLQSQQPENFRLMLSQLPKEQGEVIQKNL